MHRNVPYTARACALAALAIALGFPSTAAALPIISEVFYDASGSDDGETFVELFGLAGTDLSGFSLEGVNGSGGAVGPVVLLSGLIPSDGLFVVADRTSGGATSVANFDLLANFDFQNGPDSIRLVFAASVVDAVGYGVFGAGDVFAGEGAAAVDPPSGSSLARRFANIDTDDNAADFIELASPTPGSAPISSVPEPNTALLVMTGLGGLAVWRRRYARSEPVILCVATRTPAQI